MTGIQKFTACAAAGLLALLITVETGAAVKQIPRPGQFQIVTSGDGTRAWRINTLTGEILYCSPKEGLKLPACEPVDTTPRLRGKDIPDSY